MSCRICVSLCDGAVMSGFPRWTGSVSARYLGVGSSRGTPADAVAAGDGSAAKKCGISRFGLCGVRARGTGRLCRPGGKNRITVKDSPITGTVL